MALLELPPAVDRASKFDPALETQCWSWHVPDSPLEAGLRLIVERCEREGPFDGAFGFSQGTCMLTLLSDATVWQACGGRSATFPPWRFLLLGCGTDHLLRSAQAPAMSALPLAVPSLHLMGKRDAILAQSRALSRRFASPVLLEHEHGHVVPIGLADPNHPVRARIHRFIQEHSSRHFTQGANAESAAAPSLDDPD